MREYLSAVAGVLFIVGYVPYIRAIVRGETKPSKASWIIWASLDVITLAGMTAANTVNGQIIGALCGACIVAGLSSWYGTPGWTRLDVVCLVGGAVAIGLLLAVDDPAFSILTSVTAMTIGALPTIRSAFEDPTREDKTAWTIYWLSCVCAVLAIPQWTIADAAQPVAFFTIETTMMIILYCPPRRRAEETPHSPSGSPQTERRRR